MKDENGFTLIELLAIIVILAIIAVITVPIILTIIENSKKGAVIDSVYGYKDAISKFYVTKLSEDSNFRFNDSLYSIGKLKNMGVSISGQEPNDNSWVRLQNNNISEGCFQFDEYKVDITDGVIGNAVKGECEDHSLRFTDSNEDGVISAGDYVKIGDEGFYVIASPSDGKVKLITEYNICKYTDTIYKQHASSYCTIKFSASEYWIDSNTGAALSNYSKDSNGYAYIYDSNSDTFEYVEKYDEYLVGLGINVLDARLLSYNEALGTGCTRNADSCPTYMDNNAYDFWIGSSYRLGSSEGYATYISTYGSGFITFTPINYYNLNTSSYSYYNHSVRPLIEVNLSELVGI